MAGKCGEGQHERSRASWSERRTGKPVIDVHGNRQVVERRVGMGTSLNSLGACGEGPPGRCWQTCTQPGEREVVVKDKCKRVEARYGPAEKEINPGATRRRGGSLSRLANKAQKFVRLVRL
jgi:hypothetical protein